MDFKQLQLFVSIGRELHFARVALQFNMTASAVTRSIQRLEEELGFTLILRNNRRVELTPAGETFSVFAQDILLQWQHR